MPSINPRFAEDLKKFGARDFHLCFNCGNCTAICAISDKTSSFPREMLRYSVLGLTDSVKASLKPWQCYYCGECSSDCPRQAHPGELMMSLRRYLISKYDWTGISGLLFRNIIAYIIAFIMVIAAIAALYSGYSLTHAQWLHYGHFFEMLAIAGVFVIILLPNIIRMWWFTLWHKTRIFPMKQYFIAMGELFIHMFTQKRSLTCNTSNDNKIWWFEHFILVIGYLGLLFTTVFLDWFSTENKGIILLGYLLSSVVFIVTFEFIIRRFRKKNEKSTFTHPSDWFFVIWLFLMGLSAFIVRVLIDLNLLNQNFWVYLTHLTILAQWALIIVPFGKWTHFLYRSFAMYFLKVEQLITKKEA